MVVKHDSTCVARRHGRDKRETRVERECHYTGPRIVVYLDNCICGWSRIWYDGREAGVLATAPSVIISLTFEITVEWLIEW
jgi:hypothetical protein